MKLGGGRGPLPHCERADLLAASVLKDDFELSHQVSPCFSYLYLLKYASRVYFTPGSQIIQERRPES